MKKSVLVNYTGGFCGNFFTHLLAESLGIEHTHSSNHLNAHFYKPRDIDTKYIKTFGKLFEIRKGELERSHLKEVEEKNLDAFYTYIDHLYNILYDEEEDTFFENIKHHYAETMKQQKTDVFVCCVHYTSQYKNLKLSDVFPDSSIVHFYTTEKRHTRYFHLLFHFKNREDQADQIFQGTTLSAKRIDDDIVNPINKKCFDDRAIPFNVGRAVFERDESQIEAVEEALTRDTGRKVRIDRREWLRYVDLNTEIIESILGRNFETLSEEEQIQRSLRFIDEKVRR